MKGKKIDRSFLSEFISDCVKNGITSSEDILILAKNKVNHIDCQIKEVEKMKVMRSKLLDVISTFDKSTKSSKNEIKLLSFYKIQNQNIGEFISKFIMNSNEININSILHENYSKSDLFFCIKQLIEAKVLIKNGDKLSKGCMYDDYNKFVLRG